MRVYIIRHGKAAEAPAVATRSGGGRSGDYERELTTRGRAQAAFLAEKIALVQPAPEAILASPYPRAVQTAEPIEAALRCPMSTEADLEVDAEVSRALDLIEREAAAGRKSIAMIGHNPQLGELLGVLASGLPPQEMILKTGELVALEVRTSQMVGSARIVGRLRLGPEKNDETIVGGVFAVQAGG